MERVTLASLIGLLSRRRFRVPSSFAMATAYVCEIIMPMARGIALAHLLTPEQFGLALTITIVAGILELITDLGTGQLALKLDKNVSLDTLHSVSAIRGVILGVVIAISGPLFGAIFHTKSAAWIYAIVGLCSVMRGLVHLEIKANMREYRYVGEALNTIAGQIAWTSVSLIGAVLLHDYRAMAFGLLACVTANVIVSHAMATRPWRLAWHRPTAKESMKYGGPLALNGMAFALTNLGDRTLTGATISLEKLAQYTALATSAFLPRSAVLKYLNSVFTPHFVNADTFEHQHRVGSIWLVVLSTIAATFGLGYFALGQVATTLVFGHAYHPPQTIVSLIALLGAVRYMAGLSAPPALAYGHNNILVRATVMSTSGLALGAAFLFLAPSLDHLVLGLAIGESAALLWMTLKISLIIHVRRRLAVFGAFAPLLVLTGLSVLTYLDPDQSLTMRAILLVAGSLIQLGISFAVVEMSGIRIREAAKLLFPRSKRILAMDSA